MIRRVLSTLLAATALTALAFVQAQTTIEFWMTGDETKTPAVRQIVDQYNRDNPDVTVNFRDFPNEPYKTAIQVALASPTPPDIFHNWAGDSTREWVTDGQIIDLTAYAEQDGWGESLSRASVEAFRLNGNLYGAPYSQETKYFFYNEALFADEGLTPPATFTELLELCGTLQERGHIPIAFGNSERWPGVHYLSIFNQKVVGEAVTERDYSLASSADELFTDPGYAEAFQRLLDMQDAGCFNDAVNAISPEIARAMFYTEQTAMTYCGTWCVGIMEANDFGDEFALFRMPDIEDGRGNQNYVLAAPIGVQISSRSQHTDEAARFLEYFVSEASQRVWLDVSGRLPSHPDAVSEDIASDTVMWIVSDLATADGTVMWLDQVLEASIANVYLNSIQEVLGGTMTPEQAAQEIRRQALTVKERLGL